MNKRENKVLEHLEYMNHLCLQLKNYKNKILKDIYNNKIKGTSNVSSNEEIKYDEFRNTIMRKEREQFNL